MNKNGLNMMLALAVVSGLAVTLGIYRYLQSAQGTEQIQASSSYVVVRSDTSRGSKLTAMSIKEELIEVLEDAGLGENKLVLDALGQVLRSQGSQKADDGGLQILQHIFPVTLEVIDFLRNRNILDLNRCWIYFCYGWVGRIVNI